MTTLRHRSRERPSPAEDAPRRRGRGQAITAGLALTVYVAYRMLFPDPDVGLLRTALASGVILLGAVPALGFLWHGYRESIPLFALSGLFYSATFGLPALSELADTYRPAEPQMEYTLWLVLAGLLCVHLGYYLLGGRLFAHVPPFRFRYPISNERWTMLGWWFEGLYLLWRAATIEFGLSIGTVDQLVLALGWCGKGILCYNLFAGRTSTPAKLLLLAIILPLEIGDRLVSGALAQLMLFSVCCALVYVYVRKRLPVAFMLSAGLVFVVLNPVKGQYRAMAWSGQMTDATAMEKAEMFLVCAYDHYTSPKPSSGTTAENLIIRLDHFGTTAAIVDSTPSSIPYAGGATYLPLLYSWIPRLLWPGKPVATLANDWGRRYGFLASTDFDTSYNLPWLAEFYMNFGPLGVLMGMGMIGVVFRFLAARLCSGEAGPVEVVMALPLMLQLWFAESNLALMWGSMVTLFVALYGVFKLVAEGSATAAPSTAVQWRLRHGIANGGRD